MWAKPKLFYAHVLSALTATSTAAGFAVANLLDMLEGPAWKATSTATQDIQGADPGTLTKVDYLAIANHNLNTVGATVDLQYSSDNFSSDVNSAFTPFIPSNDKVFVKEFSQQNIRYWRLRLTGMTAAPKISIAIWGQIAILDYATMNFDPNEQQVIANINRTQSGIISGIHTKYTKRIINMRIDDVTQTCYDNIDLWWENSGLQNFFFGWETTDHSSEVYLMLPSTRYKNTLVRNGLYRNISLSLTGRKE